MTGRFVVCADGGRGQAVLAGHHDVEDDEVGALRSRSRRNAARVLGDADAIAVLGEVLADEIANVAMIVDDGDVRCGFHGVVQSTSELLQHAESRSGKSLSECVGERFWDTR